MRLRRFGHALIVALVGVVVGCTGDANLLQGHAGGGRGPGAGTGVPGGDAGFSDAGSLDAGFVDSGYLDAGLQEGAICDLTNSDNGGCEVGFFCQLDDAGLNDRCTPGTQDGGLGPGAACDFSNPNNGGCAAGLTCQPELTPTGTQSQCIGFGGDF